MRRVVFALALATSAACTGSAGAPDCGVGDFVCNVGDASYALNCNYDACFTENVPNTPNTISVTFSGETLGIAGLPYTPAQTGDPYFVDGWTVGFNEYIAVVDNVRLNTNPTQSAIWSQMGSVVASKSGPFILDVHRCQGFVGKDGIEPASALFAWYHLDDGSAFDTSVRYAFSYDIVQAGYPAIAVNLTDQGLADYDLMVKNHWSKFVRGYAYRAAQGTYDDPTNPQNAAAMAGFASMPEPTQPQKIYFAFGWDDHTQILNCVNSDYGAEDALQNRGVQTTSNGTYIAQITIHTDHVFWDTLLHEGEPLRLDPIVAWMPADTSLTNPFFINDLTQPLSTVFDGGTPLPDRGPYMSGNGLPPFMSNQGNPSQVIMNTSGINGFPNLYPDFMAFSAQSQPHLNAQGLCYVVGQHASDPYYVPNVQPVVQ
jgi:hypothetical protein